MLLYILFLVILIKIIINLFIKINIEKFTSKQEISNKFRNITGHPSGTNSSTYNITDYSNSYKNNSNMHNQLKNEKVNINSFEDYIKKTNFYDDHIYQINDYIDDIHNPDSSSVYKNHIFGLANKNDNNQGSPQVQFDRIVNNYQEMYQDFTKYQTNDIKEKIIQYENAKNYI